MMMSFDLDFSPLYRSAIGFDHMANLLQKMQIPSKQQSCYPPYNIELLGENLYRITMAVAGFNESELDIESKENVLSVIGKKPAEKKKSSFLHQGIATRNFEHRFQLADHVKVVGASMENGLLHIELEREIPEAKKPKKIKIGVSVLEN